MSTFSNSTRRVGGASRTRIPLARTSLSGLVVAALLVALWPARAEDPEAQYVSIYALIQQADSLEASGKLAPALAKYRQAETNLVTFQRDHPLWNVNVVAYRLKYLAGKVATLSAPPAAPKEAAPAETKAAAPTSTRLKLLEAGAEPRKELRLHPSAGDKETLGLTLKMAMEMKIAGMQSPPVKLPAMKLTMDWTVKTISADGDIAYDMVISDASAAEDPDVMPQIAQAMKASLGGIKGLSGTGTLSNRGFSKGSEVKAPASADPQARQMVDQVKSLPSQLAIPLPEEAVGPGAKWEVQMPIKSQGMTINQTATYQLVSNEDERLTVKGTITQQAAKQKIQNPALAGAKVDLNKMVGNGTSDLTWNLAQLLPSAGSVDFHSDVSMSMSAGGQQQSMDMKVDENIRLEAK